MNDGNPTAMRGLQRVLIEILDPRKLLFAAALVAALGVVAGYVEVQNRADRELALRQGAPAPVLIQDFRPGDDVGPAGEVRITGEVDMDAAVAVSVRGSDPVRWIMIAPVFPVGELGAALLARNEAPDDAVFAAQVERRKADHPRRPIAIGLVTVPVDGPAAGEPDLRAFAEAVIGDGGQGTVVTLNGEAYQPGALALIAHGAFSAQDIALADMFVTIEPFLHGRTAALSTPRPVPERRLLFIAAFVLVVMAAGLQLWRALRPPATAAANHSDTDEDRSPSMASRHPEFAPIPSQREILAADRAEAEKRAAGPNPWIAPFRTLAQGLWAMIWLAGSALAGKLRNRRSHPEDEAL